MRFPGFVVLLVPTAGCGFFCDCTLVFRGRFDLYYSFSLGWCLKIDITCLLLFLYLLLMVLYDLLISLLVWVVVYLVVCVGLLCL